MRNELLGYLVDALESDGRSHVDNELRTNHQLRAEMELLGRALGPLEVDRGHIEPPAGLARRTIEYVFFGRTLDARGPAANAPAVARPTPAWTDSPAPARRWRFADVATAAGILVAAFSVVVPALIQSRANAQRLSCENRMQQTYAAIAGFAEHHNGKLPGPQPRPGFESKSGIYGPLITDAAYLTEHRALVCPGSDLADEDFTVPSIAQLRAAKGRELERLIRIMGGTYAFAVGYRDDQGDYHQLVRRNGDSFPIMADLSGENGKPIGHHGGCGRNVLTSDGVTKYLITCRMANCDNNIYLNDNGEQDAGTRPNDFVLLPGYLGLRVFENR